MSEAAFIARIDCRFPYHDDAAGLALIDEAVAWSANACFAILEELARPPRSAAADEATRLRWMDALAERFDHPLKTLLFDLARALVLGRRVALRTALDAAEAIGAHPGQYAALNLAYFAASDEADEALTRACDAIREAWSSELEAAKDREVIG